MRVRDLFLVAAATLSLYSCVESNTKEGQKQGVKPQVFDYEEVDKGFDAERLVYIDSAMQYYVEAGMLPQAVTFVAKGGKVVHNKAYGYRDIESGVHCETGDIFRMASQTKAIAVVALMTLYEEGKFQLDEPIKRYIPAFENPQVLVSYDKKSGEMKTRPASRDITIRDLMTHTSGISYHGEHWQIKERAGVPQLMSMDSITLEDVMERLGKLPLAHDPGTAFTYSMNIEVLGRLAEVLSGKPVDVFIRERVLDPLGMDRTRFFITDQDSTNLVTLYTYPKGGPMQRVTNELYQYYPIRGAKSYFSTGAGLSGPIEDYAKFCQMILNGGTFNGKRILGRKTLTFMQENQVKNLRGDVGFGLAWDVFDEGFRYKSMISEGSMRWGGMFGTDYIIDPSEDLIILFYTNLEPNRTGVDFKGLMHQLTYQALSNE